MQPVVRLLWSEQIAGAAQLEIPQRDAIARMRFLAETARGLLDHPWSLFGDLPLMRGAAAAMTLLSRAGLSHERQPFGITSTSVDGAEVAVSEETAVTGPFCNLLHFRKTAGPEQPKLLIVATPEILEPQATAKVRSCWLVPL